MPDIDNKVVSISFNNKQFLRDVEDTISVIEELNEATSGKKIDSSGIENLGRAFRNTTGDLTKQADSVVSAFHNIQTAANTNFQTGGIDALRKALENAGMSATDVEDTITSLQQLSRTGLSYVSDLGVGATAQEIQNASNDTRSIITQDIDDVTDRFSALEMIAMGVTIAIGEKIADIGANAFRSLTAGIRDGWGEYNSLTNSTQTILVNTERWGTTIEDVSGALSVLNEYADRTTYAFSDMTRNIGYFTTAGVNLEDSVTAIQGLSNVGALFGADASAVARAGYQMSQALSAGVIKLMDWRSMTNAGMGGKVLQDELIRTAAIMSGTSVDAMNDYIESLGGWNASLQEGWLTSDVFLEAMKTFAGQTREYYESLTDENGNRLYDDETIDYLVKLGEEANESATKVRTFQQMMDAFKESIGSGWARTFQLIIGNLEEAKEFWTPINNILTSLVDRFFTLQNASLELWRTLGGREELMRGIQNALTALSDVLGAIGRGFIAAFGGTNTIGSRLVGITEAITDFTESLMLSEEELGFVQDFFTGLFEPISLVVEVIFELVKAFFDAGDSALSLSHSADSLYDVIGSFRHALLAVLGYVGSVLKAGANFIKNSRIIKKVIQGLVKIISKTFGGLVKIISAPFVALWQVWDKYNITGKLDEFATKVAAFFLPLIDAVEEASSVIGEWFDTFVDMVSSTITALDPIETFMQVFTAIKQLFTDLFDPTVSVSTAFSNFFGTLKGSNIAIILEAVQSGFSNLWSSLKETAIGQWFEDLGSKIQNAAASFAETSFGQKIIELGNSIREFLGIDTSDWVLFWDATKLMLTDVADAIGTGWEKIKTFFNELVNIIKDWFGFTDGSDETVSDAINDTIGSTDDSVMEDKIETMEKTGNAIVKFVEGTSKAVAAAEEIIPDPKESRFLNFLKDLPEKLKELSDSVSDGSLIASVGEFFGGMFESIKDFFTSTIFDGDTDILSWLAEKAQLLADIISQFLGIEAFNLAETGVFGAIGSILTGIFNMFSGISESALDNIDSIARTVVRVLTGLISLKIVSTISSLANAAQAGAKGWQAQQQAKKFAAIADMLKSIALLVIGIGAVIGLLAIALNSGYVTPGQLIGITALIVVIFAALGGMIWAIEKAAKDVKPGNLSGVSRMLSKMGKLLITTVLAIAAIVGIAYVVYKILNSVDDPAMFLVVLGVITAVFAVIMFVSIALTSIVFAFSNKMASGADAMSAVGDILDGISGLFTSVIILLVGILASVAAFTLFIDYIDRNGMWKALGGAVLSIVVILVLAAAAVAALLLIAKKMSSGIAGVKPSNFKQIMMLMSGLLVTIMASVVILIMAMTAFVSMMASTGVSNKQMIIAAGIIIGLVLSVFIGLSQLFKSLKGIASLKQFGVWSSFAVMIFTLLALGVFVSELLKVVADLSNTVQNIGTFWSTLGGLAAIMIALIAGTAVIFKMVNDMQFIDIETAKSFGVIMGSFIIITLALCGIAHAMSLLVQAIGAAGLSGADIVAVGIILAGMIAVILGATYGLLHMSKIKISKKLFGVLAGFAVVCGGLYAVAAGLSLLSNISIAQLITAGAVIGAITFVGVSLIAMLALLAGLMPGGVGMAALGVAAGAIVAFAASMLALGYSLKLVSESFDIFTTALEKLSRINGRKIRSNLHEMVKAIPDAILVIAGGIVAANEVIVGAGATLGTALATGLFTAINTFNTLIQANIVAITTAISSILIGIIKGNLLALKDFISTLVKPGSPLWDIIDDLGKFAVSASEYLGYYGFYMVVKFFEGVVGAIEDLGWVDIIIEKINDIVNAVKQWWNDHVANPFAQSINDLFSSLAKARTRLASGINDLEIAELEDQLGEYWFNEETGLWEHSTPFGWFTALDQNKPAELQARLDELRADAEQYESDLEAISNYHNQQSGEITDFYDSQNAYYQSIHDSVASMIESERLARNIFEHAPRASDYTGYNTYIPDQYRGAGLDVRREADEVSTGLATLGTALQTFLGISDGQSIGDALRNLLGLSEGESIISSIGGILGLGDLGSLFGSAGESSGTSFLDGFATSLTTTDLSLSMANLIPDDVLNPVITPTVDTSGVSLGVNTITDLFKNANIDEFALDAGKSMLLREAAKGDAATNGNVVYEFTQINQSPKALSPIEIYKDTQNLFRGVVNNT